MKDGEDIEQFNKEMAIDLWNMRLEQPRRAKREVQSEVQSYPECDMPLRIAGWVDKVQ